MARDNILEKVTCLITRKNGGNTELLLIQHPYAGIQLPAGTVEMNEDHKQAALREAFEETGLDEFPSCSLIGKQKVHFPGDKFVIYENAKVYSRPDVRSSTWAEIRRGISVRYERSDGDFIQISYTEDDRIDAPSYITYQIIGWVEKTKLASNVTRYFYHLHSTCTQSKWEREADHHLFTLFWAPLDHLPALVPPQQQWLEFVRRELDYSF